MTASIVPAPAPAPPSGPPRLQADEASFRTKILGSPPALQWTFYSTAKLLALHDYCETAPAWRVAAVLLLTPAPALLGSLLPSLVPLQHPLAGAAANHGIILHCFVCISMVTYGTIVLTLGATQIPHEQYSHVKAVGIALVVTAAITALEVALSHAWRFPVPFFDMLGVPVWLATMWLLHKLCLKREFAQYPALAATLFRYGKPLMLQSAQFGVYTLLTIVFERVATVYQLLMVLLFPVVKLALKRMLHKVTGELEEMSGEVVVSTIEICASLYQSMIMQTAPSTSALVAIMGIDVAQALLAIKLFMGRKITTPHKDVFAKAITVLQRSASQTKDRLASRKFSVFHATLPTDEAVVVTEALQLASAIDRVVLIEYFEVSVPVVNALFLLATFRSTSTLYNTRLNRFYNDASLVLDATTSVLVYALLQGVSLVVFLVVLRRRHNLSALKHLAFVLEYHARSIQGKLLTFFTVIFYFTLLHYGVDFSLRFDLARLIEDSGIRIPAAP